PRPVTVAVGSAGTGPLVWQRADHRAELGLDQGLVDRFGGLPDPVIDLSGLECLQDFQQCRLVQGHRVLSFRENHWRGLADHHTVASPACSGTPSGPITYTTGRDAALPLLSSDSRSATQACRLTRDRVRRDLGSRLSAGERP